MKTFIYRGAFLVMALIGLLSARPAHANEDRILWYSVGDGLTNLTKLQQAIDFCVANKFNAICFLARYRADAYYTPNRDFAAYPNPEPRKSTDDPLQFVIDRAHDAGLRVYISFSCFLVTSSNTYPAFMPSGSVTWKYNSASSDQTYAPASGFPRAMTTADDSSGLWADVGRNDVRTYTLNVMKDIVQNYDIDGIILDRVRYRGDSLPHNTQAYGYNPTALSNMIAAGESISMTPAPGAAVFINARRNAVTKFITQATNEIHAMKPWIIMGAAPVIYSTTLNSTYNTVFQHFPSWNAAANPGHVSGFGNLDFVAPQYYRTTAAVNANLMNLVNADIDEINRIRHQGIFPPYLPYPANEMAQSICDLRQKNMNGWQTFAYNDTSAAGYVSGINSTNTSPCGTNVIATATAPANFPNKTGWDTLPPNPTTDASAVGGFRTCTLTWTPPAPAADGDTAVRYLIYRSNGPGVKQYYANQAGRTTTITGSSFTDTEAPAGSNIYYKIVAVDNYNNKTAVEVGPVNIQGMDIYVESRQSAANGSGTTPAPTYSEVGALADTTAKSTAPGLVGAGARYTGVVGRSATFRPNITLTGNYNVYVTLGSGSNNNANASYTITNSSADRTGSVYLTTNASSPAGLVNGWYLLESNVPMPVGQTNGITFVNLDGNTSVGARFVMDAVRFELISLPQTSVSDWSLFN